MTEQEKANRELGRALRDLRFEAGITQEVVAYHAGYEQPHVSRVEYGLSPANVQMLAGYAKATRNAEKVLALVQSTLQKK